jgi:hypothetical protein
MRMKNVLSHLLLGIIFASVSPLHAEYATRQFLWEQANAQASSASKPEEFGKAALTYERLVAEGVVTAPLLMNLGASYVMAGESSKAMNTFLRAERYVGSTPEIKQGLLAALSKQSGQQRKELPWVRTALFWHYSLPCQVRVWIALVAWTLFWGGLFLRLLMRHHNIHALASLSETGMFVGGVTTVIFAASVIVTVLQEVL